MLCTGEILSYSRQTAMDAHAYTTVRISKLKNSDYCGHPIQRNIAVARTVCIELREHCGVATSLSPPATAYIHVYECLKRHVITSNSQAVMWSGAEEPTMLTTFVSRTLAGDKPIGPSREFSSQERLFVGL